MLERISPFLSKGGYFVLDDVYQWSGAKNAYIDYFQVDLNWLQEQQQQTATTSTATATTPKKPSCWTMVKDKKTGVERYYRLVLDLRATAQAISAATAMQLPLLPDSSSVPRCVPPPPTTGSSTTTTATMP
jgi:hypothetical protein